MSDPAPAREARWAGVSAVAGVILFAGANALWGFEQPAPGAQADEVVGFYGSIPTRIVAGALLSLISYALLVVCASALRAILVRLEGDELLANACFGGMLLGLAAGTSAEVINMAAAIRSGDGGLTGSLALAMFDISYVFGSYAGGVGFGVSILAVSLCALRTGQLLPRWLAVVGAVGGVALITPLVAYAIGEYTFLVPFALLLVVGVRLLVGSALTPRSARA